MNSNPPIPERDSQLVSDYDFELPQELIAQQPPEERGTSRMLVLNREQPAGAGISDQNFADLPGLLTSGDLLVLNDSRVIPARLFARRTTVRGLQEPSAHIEVLLTSPDGEGNWNALVKPGRKVRAEDNLEFLAPDGTVALTAKVLQHGEYGQRLIRFNPVEDFFSVLDEIGQMPLPPYIKRAESDQNETEDRERYQTVFAAHRGSVAAPTAGLHFTPSILDAVSARGVEIARITLHVGLGTFAPLRVNRLDQIRLHTERYSFPLATADALNRARAEHRRVVAVGTTTVRTLEHVAWQAQHAGVEIVPHSGETSIFISPGFQFRLVGAILTNFHLPQSSLLMLVSAFAGREQVLNAYAHAVRQRYRFFSYGDCMFII
jgi:S-adenosylmethionine:tRNA ribosyltransferase-isomerase